MHTASPEKPDPWRYLKRAAIILSLVLYPLPALMHAIRIKDKYTRLTFLFYAILGATIFEINVISIVSTRNKWYCPLVAAIAVVTYSSIGVMFFHAFISLKDKSERAARS